ncbi:hypothetical protein C8R43DRAFT_948747 [Mycena crocata]|nr:hypothetical protein C8R43DRAFT_948747 [Mycena crocata]
MYVNPSICAPSELEPRSPGFLIYHCSEHASTCSAKRKGDFGQGQKGTRQKKITKDSPCPKVNVMGQASSLARQGPYADQDPRSTEVNKEVDGWPGVPMEDLEDVSDMEEYSSRRVEPNYIWHVMRREGKLKKDTLTVVKRGSQHRFEGGRREIQDIGFRYVVSKPAGWLSGGLMCRLAPEVRVIMRPDAVEAMCWPPAPFFLKVLTENADRPGILPLLAGTRGISTHRVKASGVDMWWFDASLSTRSTWMDAVGDSTLASGGFFFLKKGVKMPSKWS